MDSLASGSGTGNGGGNTKPSTKSTRVTRACTNCRKRKVRCDGPASNGSCALCASSGIECIFAESATRRGPPKGYVESLERRLEAMEALLQSLSTATSPDALQSLLQDGRSQLDGGGGAGSFSAEGVRNHSASASPAGVSSASSPCDGMYAVNGNATGTGSNTALSDAASASLDSMDQLADVLDQLSVDKDRYVGRGSGLHLAHSVNDLTHTGMSFPNEDDSVPSLVEKMIQTDHLHLASSTASSAKMPPPELRARLVDAYFDVINVQVAVVHRPSFDRHVANGLLESDSSFRSLYCMVCALGARLIRDSDDILAPPPSASHPHGDKQSRGYELFRAASAASSPPLTSATLFDIQGSVLAVVWLLGSASPISAWAAVGFALRRVVDVGAHREKRARWTASPLEDQLRKRSFHLLFGLDRMISISLGRPLAMQEEDFDVTEPLDISDADLDIWDSNPAAGPPPPPKVDSVLRCTKLFVSLSQIQGQVLKKLYGMKTEHQNPQKTAEVVQHLDSMLNAWLESVPPSLKWNPAEQNSQTLAVSVALYTHYYNTQILVHREFLSPNRTRVVGFPSLAICSNAARSLANILNVLKQHDKLEAAFWYAPMSAVTAGLILLINVYSGASKSTNLTSSALKDVKRCINVLGVMAEDTFIARKCFVALTRLVSTAADAQLPDTATAPHATQTPASLKRAHPSYAYSAWLDGESPVSVSGPSSATLPSRQQQASSFSSSNNSNSSSPGHEAEYYNDSAAAATDRKRTKREQPDHSQGGSGLGSNSFLPQSTNDLSLATFNGRPTFSFDIGSSGGMNPMDASAMSFDSWPSQQQMPLPEVNSDPPTHADLMAYLGGANGSNSADFQQPEFDFEAAMAAVNGASTSMPLSTSTPMCPMPPVSQTAPIDALLFGSAGVGGVSLPTSSAALSSFLGNAGTTSTPASFINLPPAPTPQSQPQPPPGLLTPLGLSSRHAGGQSGDQGGQRTATTGAGAFDPMSTSGFDFTSRTDGGGGAGFSPGFGFGMGTGDMWDRNNMFTEFDFSAFSTFSPAAYTASPAPYVVGDQQQ